MSADRLRRAAAKIRETAQAAYPGPWCWDENYGESGDEGLALTNDAGDEVIGSYNHHCCSFRYDPTVRDQEKAHIALWSPDVAELVARVLGRTAASLHRHGEAGDLTSAEKSAITLARRILGEQP